MSTRDVARALGVSPTTVQMMVEKGVLKAWRTSGGHRRISEASMHALLRQRPSSRGEALTLALQVLVAEDDEQILKLYEAKFKAWKLPVDLTMVSDGLEALIALGRNPPDVLIADLALPRVDGFEMLRMLRKDRAFSDMDIIVVSALSRDSVSKRGGVPAGITVLSKPIPYEQLLGFLQACIARRKIHPALAQ